MTIKNILKIIAVLVILFANVACSTTKYNDADYNTKYKQGRTYLGNKKLVSLGLQRITFYNGHEDKWGRRVAACTKLRAQEGVTIAAHKSFPFYKQLYIPGLQGVKGTNEFVIQDRGGALNRRTASRGTTEVFDVFLDGRHNRLRQIAKMNQPYLEVYVVQDETR